MANLPRELGQQGFGQDLGNALAKIGMVLGEQKRQQFVDQTLDEALKSVDPSKPETVFPNLIKKLSTIQNVPEAEGAMSSMKMGGSLFDMLSASQTHKEQELDRRYQTAYQDYSTLFKHYTAARESNDLDTQRKDYEALQEKAAQMHGIYPERSAGITDIPAPVGYGKKYMSDVVEKTQRAAKLAAEIPMMDLKQAIGMRRTVETMENDQTKAIQKAEDQILNADNAKSNAAVREQYFPGSKPEEVDNIVSEAKQIIQQAKDTKDALHNNYIEIERRYQQRHPDSATGKRFSQKNTEISQEDKEKLTWIQNPKNETHTNYKFWVNDLKKRGVIK